MPLNSSQLRKVTFTFWGWCALLAFAVVLHFSNTGVNHNSCKAVDCQYHHTQQGCIGENVSGTQACVWEPEFNRLPGVSLEQCTLNCTFMLKSTKKGAPALVARNERHCAELPGSCLWDDTKNLCIDLDVGSAELQQLIGIAIEFIGTTLSVIGLNGQKWALERTKGQHTGEPEGANICMRIWHWLVFNWRWAIAFAIFLAGQGTISVAQNYGTQAVLTTITALSVVTNAIIANKVFGKPFTMRPTEKFGPRLLRGWDLGCCLTIFIGVGMSAFAAPDPPHNLIVIPDEACPDTDVFRSYFEGLIFLFWFLVVLGIAVTCFMRIFVINAEGANERSRAASHKLSVYGPPPSFDPWASIKLRMNLVLHSEAYMYGILTAMTGAMSITFSKPAVSLLHWTFDPHLAYKAINGTVNIIVFTIFIVGLVVCAVANVVFLNIGMRDNDPNIVYPLYSVLNTVIVALTGTILYRTYEYWLWWHAIIFIVGFVLTIMGLYFLVAFRQDDEIAEEIQQRKSSAAMDGGNKSASSDDQGVELMAQTKGNSSASISSSGTSRDTSIVNPVMSELGIDTPASSDQNEGQETRAASSGVTMQTVDLADD